MKKLSLALAAFGLSLSAVALDKPQTAKDIEGLYYMEGTINEQNTGWYNRNIGAVTISSTEEGTLKINNFVYRGLSFEVEFDAAKQTITIPTGQSATDSNLTDLTVYQYSYNTRQSTPVVFNIDVEHRTLLFNGVSGSTVNEVITLAMPGMSPGTNTVANIAMAYMWFTNSQMQTRTLEQYNDGSSTAYPIWVELKDGKLIVDNFAGNGFWSYPVTFELDNTNHFAYAKDQVITVKDNLKYYLWSSADGYLEDTEVGFAGAEVEGEDGWWALTSGGTIGILNEKYTTTNPPTTTNYDKFFIEAMIFLPFNPFTETSGVGAIEADENAPVEYFNLQGVRVENPSNGIFIRRQGSEVTKVAVK